MNRPRLLIVAAVLGGLGVLAGAFGAHALRPSLSPSDLAIWDTAARYHLVHAAMAGVVCLAGPPGRALTISAVAFLLGTVVFSGSLYLLVVLDLRWLGAVTPFGGLGFLLGWGALAVGGWRDASLAARRRPLESIGDTDR